MILNKATAASAARIGAVTGTHEYHHLLSPLFSPKIDFGKSECKIRGPRSRAGFKPGPVGPPSEATNTSTRKPRTTWLIAADEAAPDTDAAICPVTSSLVTSAPCCDA